MGKKTEKGPALWLSVTEDTNGFAGERYYTQTVRIVQEDRKTEGYYPRREIIGVDDYYGDGPFYSYLRVRCQGDDKSALRTSGEPVYGFDIEYRDLCSIDTRKCARMLKTLQKIERGLAKLTETRGYTQSWGDYLGRLAEVIGCQGIVVKLSAQSAEMRGETWDWLSIGEGINRVNNLVYQWQVQTRKRLEPETEVA